MSIYGNTYSTPKPQSEQAHPDQRQNNAGGFSFVIGPWERLNRFLILGAEGGTYYVGQRDLILQNATCIEECLKLDGVKLVKTIEEISLAGRAPKQGPALFALAVCMAKGDDATRKASFEALSNVCRTGSHLQEFTKCLKGMRSFGSGVRKAYNAWYASRTPKQLAYQVTKYQQRQGMSHRDILRMARVKPASPAHEAVLRWATGAPLTSREVVRRYGDKETKRVDQDVTEHLPALISACEEIETAFGPNAAAAIIREHKLTHEMVPSEFLGSPAVWDALLGHMPMTAMIRNLGRMTANGLLAPMSEPVKYVVSQLGDSERLERARIHPLNMLVALNTYRQGHGVRGSLIWNTDPRIIDALDAAFYACFKHVEPTNMRRMVALDVSGSMCGPVISGMPGISPRVGSAAMAMVTMRTEPNWHCVGFFCGDNGHNFGRSHRSRWGAGWDAGITPLQISANQRLDDVCDYLRNLPFGGTDCALPMRYALERKIPVDCFEIYTDNESWAGSVHPHEALRSYRQKMGIYAKLIVVAMTATEFSVADPNDAGSMDVVGFDTSVPAIMADFIKGPAA